MTDVDPKSDPVPPAPPAPLAREIPIYGTATGIAYSDGSVFVVYKNLPVIDIFTYVDKTLQRQKRISRKYLDCPNDIVARGQVLHISENSKQIIHRVELTTESCSMALNFTSETWFVPSSSMTMSLNRRGNLLVSCFDQHKIIEYLSTGELVREIRIDSIVPGEISVLTHAVQLPNERNFVVTHYTRSQHRVSLIDGNTGRILRSYGTGRGPDHDQLNTPSYISMHAYSSFLVIDELNDRIIQLTVTLDLVTTLNFPWKKEGLAGGLEKKYGHPKDRPRRMFWLSELGLLFIAHDAGAYITTLKL